MMESRLKAVMQGKAVPDMTPGQMLWFTPTRIPPA
jgi:hypothetical protein